MRRGLASACSRRSWPEDGLGSGHCLGLRVQGLGLLLFGRIQEARLTPNHLTPEKSPAPVPSSMEEGTLGVFFLKVAPESANLGQASSGQRCGSCLSCCPGTPLAWWFFFGFPTREAPLTTSRRVSGVLGLLGLQVFGCGLDPCTPSSKNPPQLARDLALGMGTKRRFWRELRVIGSSRPSTTGSPHLLCALNPEPLSYLQSDASPPAACLSPAQPPSLAVYVEPSTHPSFRRHVGQSPEPFGRIWELLCALKPRTFGCFGLFSFRCSGWSVT